VEKRARGKNRHTDWTNGNGNEKESTIAALSVSGELNRQTREEKDTSKMDLEKRTLFASQKEEASEPLR